jgi:hypothetical protein
LTLDFRRSIPGLAITIRHRSRFFSLRSARLFEQIGVDGEANADRPAKDIAGGGPNGVGKCVLKPILKE